MNGILMSNKAVWLPHLIQQRKDKLAIKDLRDVNFTASLLQPSFGELEAWVEKEDKANLAVETQALPYDDLRIDRIEDRGGYKFDRGSREPHLIQNDDEGNQIFVRGEPVFFVLKGFNTFLFQEEYDLIKEVLDRIEQINIHVTYTLSPLFQVKCVLKN
jgi:hypothetical protein